MMPAPRQPLATRAKNSASTAGLLRSFERHLKADGKAEKTLSHYLSATQHFLNFAADTGIDSLTAVRREHVEMWLEALYRDYARASVRNRFIGAHIFFKWLVEEGEIRADPMANIKRPMLEETRKDVVAPKDLDKVFRVLEKAKRWRDCSIIALFYDTGIRETELANTLLENVDLDEGVIDVPHTKNKTIRRLAISPTCVRYIDRYLRVRKDELPWLIVGNRGKTTGNGLYQIVRAIFEEAGFTTLIGPHDLRHTSASHLALSGQMQESDAMKLFGWKNPAMWRHYTEQAREEAAIAAHRKASPLENLKKKPRP